MRQNRICSIIVALAMLMSVFASILVVNAEAAPTVYTDVKDGVLTIGYKNFTDATVGAVEVGVKLPEGVTAEKNDITVGEKFNIGNVEKNVVDGVVLVSQMGDDHQTGTEGVIATVALTGEAVAGGKFEFTKFAFTDSNFDSIGFAEGVEKEEYAVAGESTPTPTPTSEPEPETMFVYANGDVVAEDGTVTLTIGYKNFADTTVGAVELGVKIPDIFTAEKNDITVGEKFNIGNVEKNVVDGVVLVSQMGDDHQTGTEGVIATVKLTLKDGATVPAEGVKAEFTKFAFTDNNFDSIGLAQGVKTYAKPVTADNGGSTPTPTPTPDVTPTPEPTPVTKFDNKVTSTTDSKLGMKMFSANIKIGEGENVNEVITDDDATYRIVFDAKKGTKTVGYGLVTVKGSALKTIIANGGDLGYNVSILGADTVKVHVEDSDGKAL